MQSKMEVGRVRSQVQDGRVQSRSRGAYIEDERHSCVPDSQLSAAGLVLGANLGFHGHAFGGERGVLFWCCCCEEANKGSGTRERKRDKVVEY